MGSSECYSRLAFECKVAVAEKDYLAANPVSPRLVRRIVLGEVVVDKLSRRLMPVQVLHPSLQLALLTDVGVPL